jgi:hypothetical protein
MNLEWIKTVKCPECGESTVIEERNLYFMENKSSERRTFLCGREVENSHNKWDSFRYTCTKSKAYLEFLERKKKLVIDCEKFLSGLGLEGFIVRSMIDHVDRDMRPTNS